MSGFRSQSQSVAFIVMAYIINMIIPFYYFRVHEGREIKMNFTQTSPTFYDFILLCQVIVLSLGLLCLLINRMLRYDDVSKSKMHQILFRMCYILSVLVLFTVLLA